MQTGSFTTVFKHIERKRSKPNHLRFHPKKVIKKMCKMNQYLFTYHVRNANTQTVSSTIILEYLGREKI